MARTIWYPDKGPTFNRTCTLSLKYLLVSMITQKKQYQGRLQDRCWPGYTVQRFMSSTSIWQYFYVIEHNLPVGIGSWNFASVILFTGLTNWEGVLVSSLNLVLLDHTTNTAITTTIKTTKMAADFQLGQVIFQNHFSTSIIRFKWNVHEQSVGLSFPLFS